MTICAIVAEFNPLHNGHKYILDKSKEYADYTVVVMSGDYVQRGEPALFNKYIRTRMALLNGADLVIELPACYSLSSAEGFSDGAINIINSLNCVNHLLFGAECDNVETLAQISKLINHTKDTNSSIAKLIKQGMSYPEAIASSINNSSISDIINNPNNILGIEYLRALNKYDSDVIPHPVLRLDDGYNNDRLNNDNLYSSATSIRKNIFDDQNDYLNFIPVNTHSYYTDETTPFISIDDYSDVLFYKLLSERNTGYENYRFVNEELSHKILKSLKTYTNVSEFILTLKSKNITYSRISRALFNILLDIKKDDDYSSPSYIRILGFKNDSRELLGHINKVSSIPVISRFTDADNTPMSDLDLRASHLYEQISGGHINEYQISPIII